VTLADRLRSAGELLVALSGSPITTYLFQTLADNVGAVVTADCVAVCLLDPDGRGYRVHSVSEAVLPPGPFALDEGSPGQAMLDLGKLESGLEVPTEPVDLVVLVEEAAATARALAETRDIAVETRLPATAMVLAVMGRLGQVLANLIGNAVKYTRDGGRVCVSLTTGAGEVTVEVADTGIGIPAVDLPHVFEKFYRVKNRSTEGIPGTGLGLAITRRIVETHGGRISAESTPGAGSTFAFTLPLAPA
jgi:signal transduction histidine kinase